MEKSCPRCEKLVESSDKTCDACGLEFPPALAPKCPGCGRGVHPENDMCGYCGLEFRAPKLAEPASTSTTFSFTLSSAMWPVLGLVLIGAYLKNREALNPLTSSLRSAPSATAGKAKRQADESPASEAHRPRIAHLLPTDVPEAGGFQIEGGLFDVLTGAAVSEATIVFHNPDPNDYYGAVTDDRGRYHAYLAAATAGYIITIQAPKYRPIYVIDWTPSIRSLDAATRRFIMADLLSTNPQPEHIFGLPDSQMGKSFAIVPR